MNRRLVLVDPDRPGESLEVDLLTQDEIVLTVAVPNTVVSFDLIRHGEGEPYRGRLGGRSFLFAPPAPSGGRSIVSPNRPMTPVRPRSRIPRKSDPQDRAATQPRK